MQLRVPLFVSSLSSFFVKSLPYTSVIAIWHIVPYFTIPEMSFCVGSEDLTTQTCGEQLPQGHASVMQPSACPPLGRLSAGFRDAHAASQIFRGYH